MHWMHQYTANRNVFNDRLKLFSSLTRSCKLAGREFQTNPLHSKSSPLSVWPHLFRGAGHEKRRGGESSSLAFSLHIGSFPCAQLPGPVHTAWLGRACFCVFSLGLYFCVFLCVSLICLCVPILLCFPEQLSHLPYRFWR